MAHALKIAVLAGSTLILSACGTVTVSNGYTYYGEGTREPTIIGDPQKTRVAVEAQSNDSNTHFDGWQYSSVGSAVAKSAWEDYKTSFGALPCSVINVAPYRIAPEGEEQTYTGWYGGEKEYWRADVCDATYEVAIESFRNVAGQKHFKPNGVTLVDKQRTRKTNPALSPAPVTASAPAATPAPAAAAVSAPVVKHASAPQPAYEPASVPVMAASARENPAAQADSGQDPRLELLPYNLRRIVASMPKEEQELHFKQYIK